MRRLYEWNTAANSSANNARIIDYKSKLQKILDYGKMCAAKNNIYALDNAKFEIKDFYDNAEDVGFNTVLTGTLKFYNDKPYIRETKVNFDKQSKAWTVESWVDGNVNVSHTSEKYGQGFACFLNSVSMGVPSPNKGTSEYKALFENKKSTGHSSFSVLEEFKEYTNMWEEDVSSSDNTLNEGSNNFQMSSYRVWVNGSNKELKKDRVADVIALDEIVHFINGLTQKEKDNVGCSWFWIEDDGSEGDLVVSIYDPEESYDEEDETYGERTISNWPYAEQKIQKALGIKSLY